MPRTVTCLLALLFAVAATCAQATTYYWKPGATQGLWTDLSNWSTDGINGADASALPGSADDLHGNGDYNFDLAGNSYEIARWLTPGDWNNHYLTVTNGTLAFTGEVSTHSGQINVDSGATLNLPAGSSFIPSIYTSAGMTVNVKYGGSMSVEGSVRLYNGHFVVANGGSLTFAPSNLRFGAEAHNYALTFSNAGTLSLPNGFRFDRWDLASVDAGASYTFSQTAGTLNLGGSFANAPESSDSKPGPFTVVLSGGTVNVTGDVTFDVTEATLENAVTFDVASGKTIDLSSFAFAAGSSITKTGVGSVVLPTTGATATISEGGVTLSAATYDFSGVTFGTGATINLASLGGRIDSADSSIANATFAATIPASAGTAVFYSTDSTLLAKVKADLDASVPEGFDLVVDGEELSVEAETSASFTVTGDVTAAAGWGGVVPAAGSDVAIDGAGVVATLPSSGVLPAWNSIEVKNGATLRIEADATLPAIILNKNATLEIGGNATVTMADLTGAVATSPSLVVPSLAVESGATLNVPGGMKFSDVNIDLKGVIASATAGGITFGYAAAGDTTYIGLMSDGGTISIAPGSGSYNTSSLEFCCPAAGGAVYAVGGSLTLKDTTIHPIYVQSNVEYPFTVAYQIGLNFGVNNPASSSFEVLFDNTTWGVLGSLLIKGGATFRLANGGAYMTYENLGYYGRYAQIAEKGRLVIGSGCEFRLNFMGDYGTHALEVNPSDENYQSIVVEEGGIFETYRSSGNGKGVLVASNGVYRIFQPSIYNEHYSQSSGTTTIYDTTNVPFAGFSSVNLADGSTLTFSTRNRVFWEPGHFADDSGDRVVALADVPITGGGSVALSNANVNVFGVIVKSGANTASGTASVVDPAAGVGATTLYFADGANWAGTVVAGNVALTNLTDGAAVNVDFGTLDLAVDFPIRVWTDNGGSIVTNDMLDVGTYVNNGGRLVPISAASGETLDAAGRIVIGKIDKNSPLPNAARGWSVRTSDILGDDANYLLTLKPSSGLQVILR